MISLELCEISFVFREIKTTTAKKSYQRAKYLLSLKLCLFSLCLLLFLLVLVTLCEGNHFCFIKEWYEQMRRLQWYKRRATYIW